MIDKLWPDIRKTVWDDNRKVLAGKNKPPETAIAINRPDGTPYMHVWHEPKARRLCMMFSNIPGVTTKWADVTLPDLIAALENLQRERLR